MHCLITGEHYPFKTAWGGLVYVEKKFYQSKVDIDIAQASTPVLYKESWFLLRGRTFLCSDSSNHEEHAWLEGSQATLIAQSGYQPLLVRCVIRGDGRWTRAGEVTHAWKRRCSAVSYSRESWSCSPAYRSPVVLLVSMQHHNSQLVEHILAVP